MNLKVNSKLNKSELFGDSKHISLRHRKFLRRDFSVQFPLSCTENFLMLSPDNFRISLLGRNFELGFEFPLPAKFWSCYFCLCNHGKLTEGLKISLKFSNIRNSTQFPNSQCWSANTKTCQIFFIFACVAYICMYLFFSFHKSTLKSIVNFSTIHAEYYLVREEGQI